jgi:hypothetical protein
MDRPAIADILYDLSDAELVERWKDAGPEFQQARQVLYACEGELIRRMGDRLALESEAGTMVRSPQMGDYQWQPDDLARLFGDRLTEEMWAEILTPVTTVKTNTTAVKKYAKRLGISEAELATCYFRAERKQNLEWHPPRDLETELRASIADIKAKREGVTA